MSNNEKEKVKVQKVNDKEIKVRSLTELRQDTTEKSQKAMESRIAYFDSKREAPMQDKFETVIAKAVSAVAELAQSMRKIVPEETAKKIQETWEKLMLSF
jgi:hypothetical protein